ncbi:MAG: hypothetical protein OET90_12190, partial [Desulfuromonadales bacterium]|nr:hypothetical protein [Desulfuromonadales bacterium]
LSKAYDELKTSVDAYNIATAVKSNVDGFIATTTAINNERAATLEAAQAAARRASVIKEQTAAQLTQAQATVAASKGMARLSAVEKSLLPAQTKATAAAKAHAVAQKGLATATARASTVARGASMVFGALGGPLGAIITLIGAAATAWDIFGSKAEDAAEKNQSAGADVSENLREQVQLLEERNRVAAGGTGLSAEVSNRVKEKWGGLFRRREIIQEQINLLSKTSYGGPLKRGYEKQLTGVDNEIKEFVDLLDRLGAVEKNDAELSTTDGKGYAAAQLQARAEQERAITNLLADEKQRRLLALDNFVAQERQRLEGKNFDEAEIFDRMAGIAAAATKKKEEIDAEYQQKSADAIARYNNNLIMRNGSELDKRLLQSEIFYRQQLTQLEANVTDEAELERIRKQNSKDADADRVKTINEAYSQQDQKKADALEAVMRAGMQRFGTDKEKALLELDDFVDGLRQSLSNVGLSDEEVNQKLEQIVADADAAKQAIQEGTVETLDQMNQFGVQAARNIQDVFSEFLFDPFSDNLGDMLENFADTLRKMAAEAASQQILTSLFNGMAGSETGWIQTLGNALGGVAAAATGGGATNQAAFMSNIDASQATVNPYLAASTAHTGGPISSSDKPKLVPRFHFGGLLPDEVPIIAQTGERVLSRQQNQTFDRLASLLDGSGGGGNGSGSGGMEVHVHNNASAKVSTQQRSGPG